MQQPGEDELDEDAEQRFPFACCGTIRTGHIANIFSAKMLPHSTQIATVAGDADVRVFDAAFDGGQAEAARGLRVLRCHAARTKRVVTEDSPALFLTAAEDGAVRQHDLRAPHRCRAGCPAPLARLGAGLSALALSPAAPWMFVAAGEAPHGYVFDRRFAGREVEAEWGVPPSDLPTTCVRRLGRRARGPGERRGNAHITGARMTRHSAGEVLLSYSADAVYLYDVRDAPVEVGKGPGVLRQNEKGRWGQKARGGSGDEEPEWADIEILDEDEDETDEEEGLGGFEMVVENEDASGDEESDEESTEEDKDESLPLDASHGDTDIILPQRRFAGHANVQTVKDVNFLGPESEYVASGSDDGNFFLWRKSSGALAGIYAADSDVVNVIEGHPYLPLVAASGIDTTVKLFAPASGRPSAASRMDTARAVVRRNARAAEERVEFGAMFIRYQMALRAAARRRGREAAGEDGAEYQSEEEDGPGCEFQ